jgi:hypothetical protein
MKSIRRILAAAVLTSVFAVAALATDGIMHGDRTPPPPPPPAATDNSGGDDSPAPADAPSSGEVTVIDITIECVLSVLGEMFLMY